MVAPNIAHDDSTTNATGFSKIQKIKTYQKTPHTKRDMKTPEIQQIHYVCYMQKQQKSKI